MSEAVAPSHLVLVALKFAPIHRLLMLAYRDAFERRFGNVKVTWIVADEYLRCIPLCDRVVSMGRGRRIPDRAVLSTVQDAWLVLRQVAASTSWKATDLFEEAPEGVVHVLVQATHPANSSVMRALRRLLPSVSIRYYLHEPTSWWTKYRNGDGVFMSAAVYLTQWLDLKHADMFYVSTRRALAAAGSAYPIRGLEARGRIVPLPFRDLCSSSVRLSSDANGPQILTLGRIDSRRCFDVFLGAAMEAHRRNLAWRFVVLSSQNIRVPEWASALPNIRFLMGREYTDEEMINEVCRSRLVFNVFRTPYVQSAVTPVALMCGVPVMAHVHEYEPELEAAGCVYFGEIPTPSQVADRLSTCAPFDPHTLRSFYVRKFDSSSVEIP